MSEPFDCIRGIAAPLPIANVDTDAILPAEYLKTIRRIGLGSALFAVLRADPAFVLNRAPWDHAKILIAGDNFGCGSSREHAPWALVDFGFRCIIAPSIADIFFNNCFKNGILAIALPKEEVARLLVLASDASTAEMLVDLPSQTIVAGGRPIVFAVDTGRKTRLLEGLDEIGESLRYTDNIAAYESHAIPRWRTARSLPVGS